MSSPSREAKDGPGYESHLLSSDMVFEPKMGIRKNNKGLVKVLRLRISSDSRLKNESKFEIPALLLQIR